MGPSLICWRRKWQPTPLFLPGEFHGQSCLEGYSPWGCKESYRTEQLNHHHHQSHLLGLPWGSDSKESARSAGDLGLISGWGRSPREGNVNPLLPYSFLENSIDRGAKQLQSTRSQRVRHYWATNSFTCLSFSLVYRGYFLMLSYFLNLGPVFTFTFYNFGILDML